MKYDKETGEWVFESTGRREYAYTDILGLDPSGRDVEYGSDGGFLNASDPLTVFSIQELTELADDLVARALRFRDWIMSLDKK